MLRNIQLWTGFETVLELIKALTNWKIDPTLIKVAIPSCFRVCLKGFHSRVWHAASDGLLVKWVNPACYIYYNNINYNYNVIPAILKKADFIQYFCSNSKTKKKLKKKISIHFITDSSTTDNI